MTNPDTIAVIAGEMQSLSRLGYGNAAIANKISELADRLAALDVPNSLVAEYQRWLDFYHAGEGDFDDFMRKEFPDD